MNKVPTYLWDAAEHLKTQEDMAAYLEAALEDGDPHLVVEALGDIARSKGMTNIARETGLGRESLYKALSLEGNPEFATVLKVIQSLSNYLDGCPRAMCEHQKASAWAGRVNSPGSDREVYCHGLP